MVIILQPCLLGLELVSETQAWLMMFVKTLVYGNFPRRLPSKKTGGLLTLNTGLYVRTLLGVAGLQMPVPCRGISI